MKTKRNAMKTGGLLPMIMVAVITVITLGCEKDPILLDGESLAQEVQSSGNIMTESFWVYPTGTDVNLFNGLLLLEFPEGAVMIPTEFSLASFPLHHLGLDGHNYHNRGISLTGSSSDQKFMSSNIKIHIKYDLSDDNWLKSVPTDPGNITILNVSPTIYEYDRVVSIGDCSSDFSSMIIKGSISQCGFYVVGEN